MRKQKVTWICLLSLGLMITGLNSCQSDKQKAAPPENGATSASNTAEKHTDGEKAMDNLTAAQRLEALRKKAMIQQEKRRSDAGHLSADKVVHDFGMVEPRTKLQAKFILKNDGKETLKIRNVQTSCSCLASKLQTKILEPGQSIPLTLTFSAPSMAGKVTKTARITTEPPALPDALILQVTAQVKRYIEVTPTRLELKLRGNMKNLPPLVLKSTDGKPFQITNVRSSNKALGLIYDMKSSATKHTITVKPKLDLLQKSPQSGIITIFLNHPTTKNLSVPYQVVLPYAAHPTVRRFTAIKPGQSAQAQIDIVSNYGEAFELGEMKSEKGYIKVLKTEKTAKGYKLLLQMSVPPNSKQRMPSDYLNVKIKNDPMGSLRILCYSMIR